MGWSLLRQCDFFMALVPLDAVRSPSHTHPTTLCTVVLVCLPTREPSTAPARGPPPPPGAPPPPPPRGGWDPTHPTTCVQFVARLHAHVFAICRPSSTTHTQRPEWHAMPVCVYPWAILHPRVLGDARLRLEVVKGIQGYLEAWSVAMSTMLPMHDVGAMVDLARASFLTLSSGLDAATVSALLAAVCLLPGHRPVHCCVFPRGLLPCWKRNMHVRTRSVCPPLHVAQRLREGTRSLPPCPDSVRFVLRPRGCVTAPRRCRGSPAAAHRTSRLGGAKGRPGPYHRHRSQGSIQDQLRCRWLHALCRV